jgi:glucan biosynthesis protein C
MLSPTKPAAPRVAYLDNLRILVTILVVLHHIAIAYGAPGDWYYHDVAVSGVGRILMTMFVALNASFFMGFFFLLAGYFTPRAVDRKGPARFVWDRLLRLGIPLAFFSLVFSPLIQTLLTVRAWSPGTRFWPVFWLYLKHVSFSPGPLWFVTALLIFSLTYAAIRVVAPLARTRLQPSQIRLTNRAVVAFGLVVGVATFLVRIVSPSGQTWFVFQLGDFVQYIALYIAGVLAYRNGWFDALTRRQGRQWLWVAIGLALALPILGMLGGAFDGDPSEFLGGFRWESLTGSIWWSMQGVAILMALLIQFREHVNRQGPLAREAARSTYGVYILHAPIVVAVSFLFAPTGLLPGMKFLLVSVIATAACFLVASVVRRLPLAKRIL